jgi:hypothetical protein
MPYPHCQPIGSPRLPSFDLVGWDVRLLQFDGFLYRCRNPGWCKSGQAGSPPTDARAYELFKKSLRRPPRSASTRNEANRLVFGFRKAKPCTHKTLTPTLKQVSGNSLTRPWIDSARVQGKLEMSHPKIDPSCPFLKF